MSPARPVAVCAVLALAAHAALLLGPPVPGHGQRAAAAPTAAPALDVRLQTEPGPGPDPTPLAAPQVPEPAVQPDAAAHTAAPEPPAPADSGQPNFDGGPPDLGFPDAPLPPGGVQLLAFVQVSAEGQPETVSSAALPGTNAPAAFQKVAEYALRQARFGSDAAPRTYCLLVRFAPEATAPRLAWLPGAARDASRCLAGAMPLAPREIELAAAPR